MIILYKRKYEDEYDESVIAYVPEGLKQGEYNVYLKATDELNPNCTIKFANYNVWNEKLGANLIGKIDIKNN